MIKTAFGSSVLVSMGALFLLFAPVPVLADPGERLIVFISDLHMGVGKAKLQNEPGNETWSRLEDFRWSPEFKEFLGYIGNESGDNTTLVILGDALELWQSSQGTCSGTAANDASHTGRYLKRLLPG